MSKVLFVGNTNTGKTRCLMTLLNSPPPTFTTLGCQVHMYRSPTGTIYNIWDCGSQYCGLSFGYFLKADIAILFGNNSKRWEDQIRAIVPDIQIHYVPNADPNIVRQILI